MISTKLQGGLGNQLFQWALGESLSVKNNTSLYLDTSFYNISIPNITKRNFQLSQFPNIGDLKFNTKFPIDILTYTDNFYFQNFQIEKNKNYYFEGYWQSEKYFKDIKSTILEKLSPTKEIEFFFKENYLEKGINVSLHIRRGDYVNQPEKHPVLPMEYYQKALDKLGNYDRLLIFSDDIEWCKKTLTFEKMYFVDNLPEIESLWLMSMCQHNIIANSSFSWWGAWLNKNQNKIVITPKIWFGEKLKLNTSDIIPLEWTQI
jgi:hypothetical protein